jgi:hypothetical protein
MGEESPKVKSGKGVGNRPSERSVKVTSGYAKDVRETQKAIKWATPAGSIIWREDNNILKTLL